jgi:hypothetical protein
MIKIDKDKLEQVILNEMSDLETSPCFLDSEVCIYQDNKIQVSIKVTMDEDDFVDEVSEEHTCIDLLDKALVKGEQH